MADRNQRHRYGQEGSWRDRERSYRGEGDYGRRQYSSEDGWSEDQHRAGRGQWGDPYGSAYGDYETGGDHGRGREESWDRGYGRESGRNNIRAGQPYRRKSGSYGGDYHPDRPDDERGHHESRGYLGHGAYGYGPAQYDSTGRGFASFTSEDQGGRDFVAGNNYPNGGYGRGMGGQSALYAAGAYGAAPRSGYTDSYKERGFLDRAGDEVASWFGDEEAARRREMDHTGRGPANYNRSDERILEDACDHLTRDWAVDARNVQVTVQDGEVTLDGTVTSRQQKRRAEDCVDHVSGVGHVQNNLRVKDRDDYGAAGERTAGESGSRA